MKLAEAGKTAYKMLGIVDMGKSLYRWQERHCWRSFHMDKCRVLRRTVCYRKGILPEVYGDALKMDEVTWYNSTAEASAALIAGAARCCQCWRNRMQLRIAKAKENGVDLAIIGDVQKKYADGKGFPQAALFVKEEAYNSNKEGDRRTVRLSRHVLRCQRDWMKKQSHRPLNLPAERRSSVFRTRRLSAKVWKRLNINVVPASEHVEELKKFGELFGIKDVESALVK